MTPSRTGATAVPAPGADRPTLGRYAHLLGTGMPTWDTAEARAVAAALSRAQRDRASEYEVGVLAGLQLAVRGLADALETRAAQKALLAHEPAKLRVLALLRISTRVRPVEVARELDLTTHYASRLLRTMVEDGLIAKLGRADNVDGRASVYSMTPWGQETLSRARRAGDESVEYTTSDEDVRATQVELLRNNLVMEQEARRAGGPDVIGARTRLERLAEQAAVLGEPDLEVDVLSELSTVLRQSGNSDKARVLVDEKFTGAAFDTDRGVLRRSYENAKLEMLAPQPDFAKVVSLLKTARSVAGETDPLRVWIELTDAERNRLEGNFVASLHCAARALKHAQHTQQAFSHIKAGVQVALIARTAGLPSEKLLLRKLLETAEISGYGVLAAECRLQLGELHRLLGQPRRAYALLVAAEKELGEHSSVRAAAFAKSAVAACAFEYDKGGVLEEHVDAWTHLNSALKFADSVGAADAQALTLRRLGVMAADRGDARKALTFLSQSQEMYATSNRRSVVGQLECQATMATLAPTAAAAEAGVTLFDELLLRAAQVDTPDTNASIVDSWVIDRLQDSALAAGRPEAAERMREQWAELRESKFVGARTQAPGSAMGREPVLI